MKLKLDNIEETVNDCKTLNDLNEISRFINNKFNNINNLIKNKRIELTPAVVKKVDRRKVLKELNEMVTRRNI